MKKLIVIAMLLAAPTSVFADWGKSRGCDDRYKPNKHQDYYYNNNYGNHQNYSYYNNGYKFQRPPFQRPSFQNTINYGINSGRLSRDEVADLYEKSSDIRRKEEKYWSDGHLSYKEREKLQDARYDLNRDLAHEMNDGERRYK